MVTAKVLLVDDDMITCTIITCRRRHGYMHNYYL